MNDTTPNDELQELIDHLREQAGIHARQRAANNDGIAHGLEYAADELEDVVADG